MNFKIHRLNSLFYDVYYFHIFARWTYRISLLFYIAAMSYASSGDLVEKAPLPPNRLLRRKGAGRKNNS